MFDVQHEFDKNRALIVLNVFQQGNLRQQSCGIYSCDIKKIIILVVHILCNELPIYTWDGR